MNFSYNKAAIKILQDKYNLNKNTVIYFVNKDTAEIETVQKTNSEGEVTNQKALFWIKNGKLECVTKKDETTHDDEWLNNICKQVALEILIPKS